MIDQFVYYIQERESIRLKKLAGQPQPWTDDAILAKYKFTNVHRVHDRTTQELLKLYDANAQSSLPNAVLLNCAIYRYFGTYEFAHAVGWQNRWNLLHVQTTAAARKAAGLRVFTGAYIVTSGGRPGAKEVIVCEILSGLWSMAVHITDTMQSLQLWEAGYDIMRKVNGFGGSGFMCKEVLQDYLLTAHGKGFRDADTWTPVGPGAQRGLNRIHGRPLEKWTKEVEAIAEVQALREQVNGMITMDPLTAHDIQFCLCEFDKYQRVLHGQGRPRSTYTPHKEV